MLAPTVSQLARDLDTLPIEVGKVHLWLVYRQAKPMTSIVLSFDWGTDSAQQANLQAWLQTAGLVYTLSQKYANTLHIAANPELLAQNATFELQDDYQAHVVRGQLYGFPPAAVEAYAKQITNGQPLWPNQTLRHASQLHELQSQYWYPYIEYLVRRGHESADAKVARRWADLARAEIPTVAAIYEQENRQAFAQRFPSFK